MSRHRLDGRETPVIDLLLPARHIQLDDLHPLRIIEVSWRVVKRQMSILSDPEADEIEWLLRKQGLKTQAFCFRIDRFPADLVKSLRWNLRNEVFPPVRAKVLGMICLQARYGPHECEGGQKELSREVGR